METLEGARRFRSERLEDLEPFHADRLVSRMLGMGDILTLVEKAEQAVSREEAIELEAKIRRDEFTLEDLRRQLDTLRTMGPLEQIMSMIPGLNRLRPDKADVDPRQLSRTAAIIDSMTPRERRNASLIDGSRRRRIARGSGTTVEEVNRLLKQFLQMRKMLKSVSGLTRGKKRRGLGTLGLTR
jgi:signal recognition particle subunit SRP54